MFVNIELPDLGIIMNRGGWISRWVSSDAIIAGGVNRDDSRPWATLRLSGGIDVVAVRDGGLNPQKCWL